MIRPPLHVDGRYALVAGLAALAVAALMVLAAFLGAARIDQEPTPTSYIVGPVGDDVVIAPRTAP